MPVSIWQRGHGWIVSAGNVDPAALARTMKAAGLTVALVQAHDGLEPRNETELAEPSWRAPFAEQGITLGVWGVLRTAPEDEAELAATLAHRYLSFGRRLYVANAEAEFQQANGGLDRSRRFVGRYRRKAPILRSGLCSFGRGWMHPSQGWLPTDLDWAPWSSRGFRACPMAYDGAGNLYPVDTVVDAYQAAGFGAARVHPVLPLFGAWPGIPTLINSLVEGRPAGFTSGFGVYPVEYLHPDQALELGRGVRRYDLAGGLG